jgi:hypothetical protein
MISIRTLSASFAAVALPIATVAASDRYRDRLRTPLIGVCDSHHGSPARRFPPPWTVEELEACFKVAAAHRQKLIALKRKRQLEEARRVMALDRHLIEITALITALPIIRRLSLDAHRPRCWVTSD